MDGGVYDGSMVRGRQDGEVTWEGTVEAARGRHMVAVSTRQDGGGGE